jgi:hypothetical protein
MERLDLSHSSEGRLAMGKQRVMMTVAEFEPWRRPYDINLPYHFYGDDADAEGRSHGATVVMQYTRDSE